MSLLSLYRYNKIKNGRQKERFQGNHEIIFIDLGDNFLA